MKSNFSEIADAGQAPANDYFQNWDGQIFAGTHLLVDLWGAEHLTDQTAIELAMKDAAIAADATILAAHLQKYSDSGGISGVLVLAESHMSIHTWPERNFAAIDIFMCGVCNPYLAVPVLERAFQPQSMSVNVQRRGLVP